MINLQVPHSIEDISADWLTGVLNKDCPGVTVNSCNAETVIHGTATKVRLMLTYDDPENAQHMPPSMWFKGGLEKHSLDPVMLKVYEGEAHFYSTYAPELKLNSPKAYASYIDRVSGESFLLLEDLLDRDAIFGYATEPATPALASQIVEELARLHARYWDDKKIAEDRWLDGGGPVTHSLYDLFQLSTWERCKALPRGEFIRGELDNFECLTSAIKRVIHHNIEHANCLVHGDAHHGNTFYTPDGKSGLLDWQGPTRNIWAHDFAYYVITALSVEDRRHAERDLVNHYIRSIAQYGITIPFDKAWFAYRQNAIYACSWTMCLPEWQPEEVCYANAERVCAAAIELNTLSAW